jgi:hypothetical protein
MALDDSSLTGEGPNASVRQVSRSVVEVSTGDGHLWLVTVKERRPREG